MLLPWYITRLLRLNNLLQDTCHILKYIFGLRKRQIPFLFHTVSLNSITIKSTTIDFCNISKVCLHLFFLNETNKTTALLHITNGYLQLDF